MNVIPPIFSEQPVLPLMGSLVGEYDIFGYLIYNLTDQQVEITSPPWLVNRCSLHVWDLINLHIAFKSGEQVFFQGKVENIKRNEDLKTNVYEVKFLNASGVRPHPVYIVLEDDRIQVKVTEDLPLLDVLSQNVKSALLLKEGIFIYLKHMIPYFSRITGYDRKQYEQVEHLIFDDIQNKLKNNIQKLTTLYEKLSHKPENIFEILNLEDLREMLESEINFDLLNLTFQDLAHVSYMTAIKDLEEQLYWYYNKIVLLLYKQMLYA